MMILFVIICVIVLSSLSYRRPRYGFGYRPLFFGAYRHHRPMHHIHMGPHSHHGPRRMHGPMGGPRH